jgi:hypothetical protein
MYSMCLCSFFTHEDVTLQQAVCSQITIVLMSGNDNENENNSDHDRNDSNNMMKKNILKSILNTIRKLKLALVKVILTHLFSL